MPTSDFLVLGDSHATVFTFLNRRLRRPVFDVCVVGGATAQGAVNPNSKTDALRIWEAALAERYQPGMKVITLLGEVDCGFVIWFYKDRHGASLRTQLRRSLDNYGRFLRDVVGRYCAPADQFVGGAMLPTIKDNTDKRYLQGARATVMATQRQRTQLTHIYNRRLQAACRTSGAHYLGINDLVTDAATGLVDDRNLNEDPGNHHLSNRTTHRFWLERLGLPAPGP